MSLSGPVPAARVAGALAGAGFRRWASYRQAAVAGIFTGTVFGVLRCSILLATVDSGGGSVAGYDVLGAATYAFVSQGLTGVVVVFTWLELAQRVRTGDIAVDLARPVDLQLSWLASDLGRGAYAAVARFTVPVAVGALTFGIRAPGSPGRTLAFVVSVVLAVAVSFGLRFVVNLAAFWLVDIRGVFTFYMVASTLLAGLVLPVHLFPDWAQVLAWATPFPALLQVPVDVWTGRAGGPPVLVLLAAQLGWAVAVLLLGRLVLARAVAKLVVQGG